jgi:hypothetical protein
MLCPRPPLSGLQGVSNLACSQTGTSLAVNQALSAVDTQLDSMQRLRSLLLPLLPTSAKCIRQLRSAHTCLWRGNSLAPARCTALP